MNSPNSAALWRHGRSPDDAANRCSRLARRANNGGRGLTRATSSCCDRRATRAGIDSKRRISAPWFRQLCPGAFERDLQGAPEHQKLIECGHRFSRAVTDRGHRAIRPLRGCKPVSVHRHEADRGIRGFHADQRIPVSIEIGGQNRVICPNHWRALDPGRTTAAKPRLRPTRDELDELDGWTSPSARGTGARWDHYLPHRVPTRHAISMLRLAVALAFAVGCSAASAKEDGKYLTTLGDCAACHTQKS